MNPGAIVADGALGSRSRSRCWRGSSRSSRRACCRSCPATSVSSAARSRRGRARCRRIAGVSSRTTAGAADARRPAPRSTQAPSRGRLLGGVLLFIAGFTVVFMAVNILGGTRRAVLPRVRRRDHPRDGRGHHPARPRLHRPLRLRAAHVQARRCAATSASIGAPAARASRSASAGRRASARRSPRSSRCRGTSAIPSGRACSASRTRSGSASRSSCSPSGSAGRRARSAFLRRHIRTVNIIGGVLLVDPRRPDGHGRLDARSWRSCRGCS